MALLSKIMVDYQDLLMNIARGGTEDTSEAVILADSPVLTSSFRESWTPSIGEPTAKNVTLTTPSTNESFPAAQEVIKTLNAGESFSLGNGKDYALKLEHGYSGKAPNGVVWINAVQWNNVVQKRASKARAG